MRTIKPIWEALSHAGVSAVPNNSIQREIIIGVNQMALCVAIINLTIGVGACVITGKLSMTIGVAIEICTSFIPVYLNFRQRYSAATVTLYAILSCATCYFCCVLGKLAQTQLMIVTLVALSRLIFTTPGKKWMGVLISFLILVIVEGNRNYHWVPEVDASEQAMLYLRWAAYATIIFLVILVFDWYTRINTFLRDKLQEYTSNVEDNLAREAQENRTKDKFITNATHEMRVSYFSMFAIINILYKLERKRPNKEIKIGLDDLRATCKQSTSLMENILEYERRKAGLPTEVQNQCLDIRMVVNSIVEIYKYMAAEKKVLINVKIDDDIPDHIFIDEMKLRQIVVNLLHNAIKHTRNRSFISISISLVNSELNFEIADGGVGISFAEREEIFQPFITTNPEGLGLGLYIVKELVSTLHGRIQVDNNLDGGATFLVVIPTGETEERLFSAMLMQ